MAGQHIAKTQTWPVSIQLKKASQQKASWPVSIKHFFAKHQLTLLQGRSQHVDPFQIQTFYNLYLTQSSYLLIAKTSQHSWHSDRPKPIFEFQKKQVCKHCVHIQYKHQSRKEAQVDLDSYTLLMMQLLLVIPHLF